MEKGKVKEYKVDYYRDEHGEYFIVQVPHKKGSVDVMVDLADFDEFAKYNWSVLSIRGVPKYMSRYIRGAKPGDKQRQQLHQMLMGTKPSTPIDHIDGNGMNCRRYNMRVATRSENARNSIKKMKGTSAYKGVVWNKRNKRWLAQIRYNGKGIYLGTFPKEIVDGIDEGEKRAARAYDAAAIKYFGTFGLTNFPGDRNTVQTLKGDKFQKSYLFNEKETRVIENKIRELKLFTNNEIMEILAVMPLPEIVNLCHYYGCGIEALVREIKKGEVLKKKHA